MSASAVNIDWFRPDPAAAGLNVDRLAEAARYAMNNETEWSLDLEDQIGKGEFEPPPWNEILGPVWPRGSTNGLVIRKGVFAAQWGDTSRADMTFSVAKSYLAVLAGVAVGDGLIKDLTDPVRNYALDDGFESPQNKAITWEHLLTQTSEWEGELWSKPDQVDRYRQIGADADNSRKGQPRKLQPPGTYWEYNDVRVNRLSLSLMQLFRRPLPDVLRERIMRPLGASENWSWHGYRNSYFEIDGRPMESVPGGTHWGGGIRIAARDQALLGLLVLNRGAWGGRQLIPEAYVDRMLSPSPIKQDYGFLWWLNANGVRHPGAPEQCFCAIGAGGNYIWVDPVNRLVVVARWLDEKALNPLIDKILDAIE